MNKKEPDKITVVKCPLKQILKDNENINKLVDVCSRTNELVIHSYQFLRLWILHKYENNLEIPEITKGTIKMVFKTLTISSRGPKPKENNLKLFEEFEKFYNEHYKNLGLEDKINGLHLSQILEYTSTDMLTNIENNIKLNFFKYVNRFVNSSFKKINAEIIEKTDEKNKKEVKQKLKKDIYLIKQDLINNTLNSDVKYHEWIKTNGDNIFFKDYKKTYEIDIESNPQRYIKSMIYMCNKIEEKETKMFQFFPLRTNITMKYITIDTKSLIEIYVDDNKNDFLKDIENKKEEIWNSIFNLKDNIFKQNNYAFDYLIMTDCYTSSIKMLHKDKISIEQTKKKNKKLKKEQNKIKTQNMTIEEKKEFKKNEEKIKKDKEIEYKIKQKEKKNELKKEFKKKSKAEQLEIKDKKGECKYIDDLNDKELKDLNKHNWVVIDVGIRVPLYMQDKNGKTLRYSNRKHAFRNKRFIYRKRMDKFKNNENITEIEKELTNYNSKSVNLKKFSDYVLNKNKINKLLFVKYNNEIFRKYKWYSHLEKKKCESKLIKDIKKSYGEDTILIFGDAGMKGNCKKGNISTPNVRLKTILKEKFKMYNIDEYKTSKLHHKTEEECKNLKLKDVKGVKRKIHAVLTFKMENNRIGCINRDENAVRNMIKIVNSQITKKERPINFRRETQKALIPQTNTTLDTGVK